MKLEGLIIQDNVVLNNMLWGSRDVILINFRRNPCDRTFQVLLLHNK
jgi:hypothetical protein